MGGPLDKDSVQASETPEEPKEELMEIGKPEQGVPIGGTYAAPKAEAAVPAVQEAAETKEDLEKRVSAEWQLTRVEGPLGQYKGDKTLAYIIEDLAKKNSLELAELGGKVIVIRIKDVVFGNWIFEPYISIATEGEDATSDFYEVSPVEVVETPEGIEFKPAFPEYYDYYERVGQIFSEHPNIDRSLTEKEQDGLPIGAELFGYAPKDEFVPSPHKGLKVKFAPVCSVEQSQEWKELKPPQESEREPYAAKAPEIKPHVRRQGKMKGF